MSDNGGETKSGSSTPEVVIPQLTPEERKALARGRTIRHHGRKVRPQKLSLRTRHYYADELGDGGYALYTARTKGVLRDIREVGEQRAAAAPVIRAIGRQNVHFGRLHNPHTKLPSRMGAQGSATEIPTFLTRHILEHEQPISDLTKTSLGAPSKRKGKTRKKRGGIKSSIEWVVENTEASINRFTNSNLPESGIGFNNMIRTMTNGEMDGGFWVVEWSKNRPEDDEYKSFHLAWTDDDTEAPELIRFVDGPNAVGGGKKRKRKKHKKKKKKTRRKRKRKTKRRKRRRMTGRRTRKAPLFPWV